MLKRLVCVAVALVVVAVVGQGNKNDGKKAESVTVVMETSMGTITIALDGEKAPITVKNFLAYVDDKYYDGTIFHRVISDFMIQGGGFTRDKKAKKTNDPIKNESGNGLSNTVGTIAMARTNDLDSATSQFYINVADNADRLDEPKYCVFGKVIKGMDVVEKIKEVPTHKAVLELNVGGKLVKLPSKDVPETDVIIKSVRRAEKPKD